MHGVVSTDINASEADRNAGEGGSSTSKQQQKKPRGAEATLQGCLHLHAAPFWSCCGVAPRSARHSTSMEGNGGFVGGLKDMHGSGALLPVIGGLTQDEGDALGASMAHNPDQFFARNGACCAPLAVPIYNPIGRLSLSHHLCNLHDL